MLLSRNGTPKTLNMEKTKLSEVIHLYLGCEVTICEYEGAPFNAKLTGVVTERTDHESMMRIQALISDGDDEGHIGWYDFDEIVDIHLRKLEDMTEEEANHLFDIHYSENGVFKWRNCFKVNRHSAEYWINYESSRRDRRNVIKFDEIKPKDFQWLLSKSFDLFNLVDSGQAINAKDHD